MSTDSTELHFVRCPSCRSLVPASSKTCRMCGAGLDAASNKADDSGAEGRRSSRVRQRTMSSGSDELNSAVQQIRQEMGTEPPPPQMASENAPAGEMADNDDPLSAYIEEIESPDASSAGGAPKVQTAPPPPPPSSPAEPASFDRVTRPVASFKPAPAPEEMERPRVVIESGGKRKGPGLSFGPRAQEEEVPTEMPEAQEFVQQAAEGPIIEDAPPPPPPRSRPAEAYDARRSDPRNERPAPGQGKQEVPRSQEMPRRTVLSGGRLAGWLVSYRDPDGKAVEIREGKFFVSRSRVKDSDLVVDDRSVSSPHALCAVAAGQRMRVQDLMSDNGVFVRRRDEQEFVRISETADLEHGDWVKFGDVEYNVCLIAHMGEK